MASVSRDFTPVQGPFSPEPRHDAPDAITAVPAPVGPIVHPTPDDAPESIYDGPEPAFPVDFDLPSDEPSWPNFTLAELADQEALAFRAWGNSVGEMFARAMEKLALQIRMTDATTPEEFEARIGVYEDDIRSQWEARGYDAGLEASRDQCRCGVEMYR